MTCSYPTDAGLKLLTRAGRKIEFVFGRSVSDIALTSFPDESVIITLHDSVPCLLLMCAETSSLFTRTVPRMKHVGLHLETLTEDDDLLSRYMVGRSGGDA